jgi:hypothetical protein
MIYWTVLMILRDEVVCLKCNQDVVSLNLGCHAGFYDDFAWSSVVGQVYRRDDTDPVLSRQRR